MSVSLKIWYISDPEEYNTYSEDRDIPTDIVIEALLFRAMFDGWTISPRVEFELTVNKNGTVSKQGSEQWLTSMK